MSEVHDLDSSGIALVSVMADVLEAQGGWLHVVGARDALREALALMPARHGAPPKEASPGALELLGEIGFGAWEETRAYRELRVRAHGHERGHDPSRRAHAGGLVSPRSVWRSA